MPLRFLLDTDTCIYIAKRRPVEVRERFKKLRPGEVAMSVITYGELCYGACKSSNAAAAEDGVRQLSALIQVLPLGPRVGEHYGRIRAELDRAGRPIGNNDLWIAAQARELGVALVTNNETEFNRVNGLVVENWARPRRSHVHESQAGYRASSRQRRKCVSSAGPRHPFRKA